MTKITLPRLNQTGANEFSDVSANDEAIANVVNGELDHTNLSSSAAITNAQLAGEIETSKLKSAKLSWYTPKYIATEETRENTSFGFLTTEDKIESVVLAENGWISIGYRATAKSSVAGAGRVALFLGTNQIKDVSGAAKEQATETTFSYITTAAGGFGTATATEEVTTGQIAVVAEWKIFAAAGTYTVGAKYKATSGSVTAKNRKLWVETHG